MTLETPNFHLALINARRSIQKIGKNTKGFNYEYADLPTVLDAVIEPLAENNIFYNSVIAFDNPEWVEIRLTYALTGEVMSTFIPLMGVFAEKAQSDKLTLMQRFGSTLTYAQRYGLLSILGLCPEKDKDAADTSHTHSKPYTPPPLKPTLKGEPFSKSLPPIPPKVEKPKIETIETDDVLIAEILNLWGIKKELCMGQDPIKGTAIQKRIDDQFMGVPAENLTNMRNYLHSIKDVIKDNLDDMEDLI